MTTKRVHLFIFQTEPLPKKQQSSENQSEKIEQFEQANITPFNTVKEIDETISTISTYAGLNQHTSDTDTSTDSKNAIKQGRKKRKGNNKVECPKDSILAFQVSQILKDSLVLDETTGDWYQCNDNIWQPISKIRATNIINKALHDFLPDGFAMSRLNGIEGFLKLYLALNKWETDKSLLPVKNGVLNTKTMVLEPYSPNRKFNWQLPYAYEPGAKIRIIKRWLWEVTSQDIEAVNIIRAFFKITLVSGNIQKFLELIGPGGTGKSTLIRLLVMIVGESNHAATDLKNLENNRFEAATLYGKKLAVISDSSRYGGEVSKLKEITGGDSIRHERKNQQQSGSFVFGGTVVIASNEAIQSTDYTSGLARRRLPITFVRKVTDEDKAKWRQYGGIEKAMQSELSGLLNWVLLMPDNEVIDCLNTINGTLSKAEREHLINTNKLAAWIDDNLIVKENHISYVGNTLKALKEKSSERHSIERECDTKLYTNYDRWCIENGVSAIGVNRFANNLDDIAKHCKLPITRLGRDSNGARISGFQIRTPADNSIPTPITHTFLNADGCRFNAEGDVSESIDNVDSADHVDETLFLDSEVF